MSPGASASDVSLPLPDEFGALVPPVPPLPLPLPRALSLSRGSVQIRLNDVPVGVIELPQEPGEYYVRRRERERERDRERDEEWLKKEDS